ncbi:YaiO family outer membrane beta-barrel protein [Daejeonella lutea]|uniref:Outer membrane protein, YaiO family n=1 Tax=Daejeonella lutea TaxID=572036 RepID=A0A1T5A879_9SPHI|nr:YaiO family outer membrane beta-barrel protein [Daejeonella lutea]SKB31211.1 outer membrane protein, YaiO family [Daejeonella lutea]
MNNCFKVVAAMLIGLICFSLDLSAQNQLSSDDLFQNARKLAFDDKNYPDAIALTKQALTISPDYADIRIFLGRLYTWTDKVDSARIEFKKVLDKNPGHEDASLAYGYLEYWNKSPETALKITEEGLKFHEKSQDLLLLKTKILDDLKQFKEANLTLNTLLKINPKLGEARALAGKIGDFGQKNKIGVGYDYVSFDKQFADPWHLGSIDYTRQTGIGSVSFRANFANRFKTNGTQFEIDAYPRISKTFYSYISGGYSKSSIFPSYRAGFSLYANLPSAFEADAGFRMLDFGTKTWIYTLAVGKYYKSYWFNLRTYLTPSNNSLSQSISFTTRYYFGGADDYLSFTAGSGLSPDNQRNNILYNNGNTYKLKSTSGSIGFRKSFNATNIFFAKASLENQEYLKDTRGNQIELGLGFVKRF